QAWARPIPMLPELDSITTPPGERMPVLQACSRIRLAGRSLMLPPGLRASNFANIQKGAFGRYLLSRTRGVSPTASRMPSQTRPAGDAVSFSPDVDRSAQEFIYM